jgi:hypothetical protein
MAKLPWYMKAKLTENGFEFTFYPLYILWLKTKSIIKIIFNATS